MNYIAAIAIYLVLLAGCYALHLRGQLHLQSATISRLRWQYVHERQRANALKASRDKQRQRVDEHWLVVQEMMECNARIERHRYVILQRWWRRRAYRSLVVAWRIGRG